MTLNLKQKQTITEMADLLYGFLPGSGAAWWPGHASFATVARQVGVEGFWTGGSKKPAIARLLELTLEHQPHLFTKLVSEVVGASMTYRSRRSDPLTRDDVEGLNSLLMRLDFKIPELWDDTFLASLPRAAPPQAEDTHTKEASRESNRIQGELAKLKEDSLQSTKLDDRQGAGRKLEALLNNLFALFGLEPRPPFRVTGEEIDGSFALDYETYLVEVKWTEERTQEGPLLEFRGRIEGKSAFTRGVFISVNGFTDAAIEAITRGKSPLFFLLDGYDLFLVFDGTVALADLLRYKFRRLVEEGRVLVRVPVEGVLHKEA